MWSLHAAQTCEIDESELQTAGYALAQTSDTAECRTSGNFKLYAVDVNQSPRTCKLQCKNGWHQTETPTMSCNAKSDHTSANGNTTFTGCDRKWCIMNGSHNDFHVWSNRISHFPTLSDVLIFHVARSFAWLPLALPYDVPVWHMYKRCVLD